MAMTASEDLETGEVEVCFSIKRTALARLLKQVIFTRLMR
jgi:hypothetical protein